MKALAIVLPILLLVGMIILLIVSLMREKDKVYEGETDKWGSRDYHYEMKKSAKVSVIVSSILAFASALILFFIPGSMHQVEAGEVAVVKRYGQVVEIKGPGLHFDNWISHKYEIYDTKVQNMEIATAAYSFDSQTMDLAMTVQYHIDSTNAGKIAEQYGSLDILSNKIQSIAIEKTKSVLTKMEAEEIIRNRAAVSPAAAEAIQLSVGSAYYVTIDNVVITNIDFTDAFEKAVEDKMIAAQDALKADYEAQKIKVQAEAEAAAAEAKAKGEAEAKQIAAKAEAQVLAQKTVAAAKMLGLNVEVTYVKTELLDAEGNKVLDEDDNVILVATEEIESYKINWTEGKQAEEQKLLADYLKYIEYLSVWDGKLPETLVGADGVLPTFDIGKDNG